LLEEGQPEAEQEGEDPDDDDEFQRAQIGQPGGLGKDGVVVVLPDEGRDDLHAVIVVEADHQQCC
jgi:hypothetical protein